MFTPVFADITFLVGTLTILAVVGIALVIARWLADLEWQKQNLVRQRNKLEGELDMLRAELRDLVLWRER